MILILRLIFLIRPDFANKLYLRYLKSKVKTNNFTIISNNCWGGGIYEDLNLPYQSPTVGLFFYAPCYIKFVQNLKYYMNLEFEGFVEYSKYKESNLFRKEKKWFYPIGILGGDIEVHFMHYKTEEECILKWNRRRARINWDQLYFKMCDRDLCTDQIRDQFLTLGHKKKVFFGSKPLFAKDYVFLKSYNGEQYVGSLYEEPWNYRKYFNLASWLNL